VVILKETPRDWGLVVIVVLLSLGANMPSEWTEWVNFDRRFFLGGLIAVIAVALIKYLKFTLILVIVFLAIGANLPEEVANEFGVDPQISLLGLVALIVMAVTNRFLKLPTGLERSGRSKTAHGAAALFTAILKGRIAVVQSLLSQGVNVNTRTISGKTPLRTSTRRTVVETRHSKSRFAAVTRALPNCLRNRALRKIDRSGCPVFVAKGPSGPFLFMALPR
jgi:hypothetical protein